MSPEIDLGHGLRLRFLPWKPDRSIPQNAELFKNIPDDERASALIAHQCKGQELDMHIGLNPAIHTSSATWTVECWDPLTLSPSLLCTVCGTHGFIRGGKWVPA